MTREEAIDRLRELQESNDIEVAHVEADDVLCKILVSLGYEDVVDEWLEVSKWYA